MPERDQSRSPQSSVPTHEMRLSITANTLVTGRPMGRLSEGCKICGATCVSEVGIFGRVESPLFKKSYAVDCYRFSHMKTSGNVIMRTELGPPYHACRIIQPASHSHIYHTRPLSAGHHEAVIKVLRVLGSTEARSKSSKRTWLFASLCRLWLKPSPYNHRYFHSLLLVFLTEMSGDSPPMIDPWCLRPLCSLPVLNAQQQNDLRSRHTLPADREIMSSVFKYINRIDWSAPRATQDGRLYRMQ